MPSNEPTPRDQRDTSDGATLLFLAILSVSTLASVVAVLVIGLH